MKIGIEIMAQIASLHRQNFPGRGTQPAMQSLEKGGLHAVLYNFVVYENSGLCSNYMHRSIIF